MRLFIDYMCVYIYIHSFLQQNFKVLEYVVLSQMLMEMLCIIQHMFYHLPSQNLKHSEFQNNMFLVFQKRDRRLAPL